MSAVQNWSRCSRHTSRSICRHSARGSTDDADAVEVDPAALARRRVRLRRGIALARALRSRGNRAQPLAVADDERRVVGGHREALDLVEQRLGAQRFEVEELEPARRFLVAAAPVRADDRQHRPEDLAAGHAGDLAEACLRQPETARRAARCRRGRRARRARCRHSSRRRRSPRVRSSGFKPFGRGSNGGRPPACSAIRYGPRGAREAESSNWTLSYTGSNVRSDRKYRYLPSGSNAGA